MRAAVRAVAAAVGERGQGRGDDRRFRPAPGAASRARRARAAADRRHLPGRRLGLGPGQPCRCGARRRRLPQHGGGLSPDARRRRCRSRRCWHVRPTCWCCRAAPTSTARRWPTICAIPSSRLLRQRGASIELPWRHVAVRHAAHRRGGGAAGRSARPASRRARDEAPRARRDGEAAQLLGALAAAAVAAFLLSLAVGPAGFGIAATGEARQR